MNIILDTVHRSNATLQKTNLFPSLGIGREGSYRVGPIKQELVLLLDTESGSNQFSPYPVM
jgi:hypothetical protein